MFWPISPVANLEPLLKTSMNNEFGMDDMMAQAESPLHQPGASCANYRLGWRERATCIS